MDYRWDIFLAYASPDRDIARTLYSLLQGLRVFADFQALLPGDDWMAVVPSALQDARVIVVLVSGHAEEARYLKDELARVSSRGERDRPGRRVVPVLLRPGLPLPYGLAPLQAIEGWQGMAHVASELRRLFKDDTAVVAPPSAPEPSMQLQELLLSLFTTAELRMFIARLPEGPRLLDHLPGEPASRAQVAWEAAQKLRDWGMLDPRFFAELRRERPGRGRDIAVVEGGLSPLLPR